MSTALRIRFIAMTLALSVLISIPPAHAAEPTAGVAPVRPPAVYSPGVAFDERRGRLVVFGGYRAPQGVTGETWEWDGRLWSRVAAAGPAPSPRNGPAMAYDARRGVVVLFGGDANNTPLTDTWTWDGTAWRKVADDGPPGRSVARAAWDPRGGEVVLVGGLVGSEVVRETWSWDGRAWARGTALAPPRFLHGLAYDSKRGGLVLFGGHVSAADPSPAGSAGETWLHERGAWTIAGVLGPSARDHVNLACDETRHRVVLYGGIEAGGFAADTWEWDGAAWHAIADAGGPGARANASLVYDRRGHRVLLYGGFAESGPTNDLWAWDGTKWTSLE